jgi:hypothetical protein
MKKAAILSILVAVAVLAVRVLAEAQQPKKVPRIGVLFPGSPATFGPRTKAFLQGLRELGYVEAKRLRLSGDGRKTKSSDFPNSRLSSSDSMSM